MSIVTTDNKHYAAISEKIREKTGTTAKIPPSEMAHGIDDAYEAGRKAEYDRFWDNHPTAKGYVSGANLFSGAGWNDKTFNPKYDIILGGCYMVFKSCAVTDLVEKLNECGVSIDFSRTNSFSYAFYESKITHIGEIPLINDLFATAESHTVSMFDSAYNLHTIDKILVNDSGTTLFSNSMFKRADSLANITFEGVIGNSINFQWCPLTKESITNIIEHLSPTVTEKTLTLNLAAKEAAFTTEEWTALTASKANWTFALV